MNAFVLASHSTLSASLFPDHWSEKKRPTGLYRTVCEIPANFLNNDTYSIDVGILNSRLEWQVWEKNLLSFLVHESGEMKKEYMGPWVGVVRPKLAWSTKRISEGRIIIRKKLNLKSIKHGFAHIITFMITLGHLPKRALGFGKGIAPTLFRNKSDYFHRDDDFKENKAEPQWQKIIGGPLRDHYMFLNLGSPASWNKEMMEGCYDSFIYDTLKELAPIRGATIWDIGAHIGYHSLAFAAQVMPTGKVFAFEPNPSNIARLQANIDRNPDLIPLITIMNCALSNNDGENDFIYSPDIDNGSSSGSHLTNVIPPEELSAYEGFTVSKVSTYMGDTLMKTDKVSRPDLMKIDVEGAEYQVLVGCSDLLETFKPLLFIEIHSVSIMYYVLNFLIDKGYSSRILDGNVNSISRCFIFAKPVKKVNL